MATKGRSPMYLDPKFLYGKCNGYSSKDETVVFFSKRFFQCWWRKDGQTASGGSLWSILIEQISTNIVSRQSVRRVFRLVLATPQNTRRRRRRRSKIPSTSDVLSSVSMSFGRAHIVCTRTVDIIKWRGILRGFFPANKKEKKSVAHVDIRDWDLWTNEWLWK